METVEIYLGGFWLHMAITFEPRYFTMQWAGGCSYDSYDDDVWGNMRESFPEMMLGDGQDYPVSYPYTRLPAFRASFLTP